MEIDALQIRIEKAKADLPQETLQAINAVDWRNALLEIKAKKGFSIEKLEDLELETELMLCGLSNPSNYEKEIRERLDLSPMEAKDIVTEMNDKVFKKIRDAFAKIMEEKNSKIEQKVQIPETKEDMSVLKQAGIEVIDNQKIQNDFINKEEKEDNIGDLDRANMLNEVENPELIKKTMPTMVMQKLSSSFNIPTTKTEYSLDNMTKEGDKKTTPTIVPVQKSIPTVKSAPKIDPYRMPIE
jgi:hypothetical protein